MVFNNIKRDRRNFEKDTFQKGEEDDGNDVRCSLSVREQAKIAEDLVLKMPEANGSDADFYTTRGYGVKKLPKDKARILIRENNALRYLSSNGVVNIPKTKGVFFDDRDAYLVSDIMAGKSVWAKDNKALGDDNLENLFKIFLEMDKALFSHNGLHFGNILIDGNKINLIDFADYFVVSDSGDSVSSNEVDFNKEVTLKPKKRLQKLISKAARGEKTIGLDFSDNPNLPFNTGVTNFEYRFLSQYLKDAETSDPKGAKRFFREYLRAKGEYYKKRAEYHNKLIDGFGNSLGKNYLRQAVLYDMAAANVLSAPSKSVLEIERLKADFKAAFFILKEKGCTKEEKAALQKQYEALILKLNELFENSFDNDTALYAEALKKIYLNPYWMREIENGILGG